MLLSEENLVRFCLINKNGQPYEVIDAAIADEVINNHDIIIMAGQPWIYEGGVYRKDDKGLHIQDYVKNLIITRLRTDSRISRIYRLILKDIRLQYDIEEVNKFPKTWINFKNGLLDVLSGEMHSHSPEYKSISQIPHNYYSGLNIEETVFHEFLSSRISEEDRLMLYDAFGHGMMPDILFQKYLTLVGNGYNGKSVILKHLTRIVGKENVAAIKLQDLSARFVTEKLVGKICNICADIPNTALKDTSNLKMLTGDDLIQAEIKHGDIFFFRNRSKFFFSCNEVPAVLDDRSNGFFRRMLIIRFHGEGKYIENLEEKLSQEREIEILISYLVQRVKEAIERGKIYESRENIEEISKLREESDTVECFLNNATVPNKDKRISRPDLYSAYTDFCRTEKRTPLGKVAFFKALRTKGYQEIKSCGKNYISGLELGFMSAEETPFDD